jgi:hypothetical protein
VSAATTSGRLSVGAYGLAVLLLAARADAQPLSADRPGVTNPPDVVARGAIQLEGGLSFERETHGDPNLHTVSVPSGLIRVGVLAPLELRVSADGYIFEARSGESDRSSGSDLSLGSRVRVLDQQGLRPATALELDMSLPTGSDPVTSDGVDPLALLLVAWDFGDRFQLDGNLMLASVSLGEHDSSRAFQVGPSLSLGASLGVHANVFIEYYSTLSDHGLADTQAVDGGLSWLVDDDLQLDVSAGAGLNDAAPNLSVSAGVAWRCFVR